MKRLVMFGAIGAMLLASSVASAHDSRVGVGVNYSAYSTGVQLDLDVTRHIGVQGTLGQSVLGEGANAALGARLYLHRGILVSPYVGGLYAWTYADGLSWSFSSRNGNSSFGENTPADARRVGATGGLLIRGDRGLGGYIQVEYLNELGASTGWAPSLGAGLQWWF